MQRLSIIIPAHNEERRIGATLEAYTSFFDSLVKIDMLDYEIIVVLNACKDKTKDVVKKHQTARIKILEFVQAGKGFAVIEGFKDALKRNNELVGFVDADLATPPEAFYDLITKIGNYGGAIASRYIPGSIVNPKPTIQRIIASRIFNLFIRAILFMPYRDTQCGAKLFKRKAIESVISNLSMSQWAFDVELLYHLRKKGFVIKEIPTRWSDKEYSKIHFAKAGPFMALSIVRLRLLNSPFKSFVKVYNKMFDYYKNQKALSYTTA